MGKSKYGDITKEKLDNELNSNIGSTNYSSELVEGGIEVTFKNKVYYWNTISGTLFAIIGDFKNINDKNCDEWGHLYGKTQRSVVEFIIGNDFRGNIKDDNNFPELRNNPVIKIERTGVRYNF